MPADLTENIKAFALDLGYSRAGIAPARNFTEYAAEVAGRGEPYAHMAERLCAAGRLEELAPRARSIVVLVWDYARNAFPESLLGKVGRVYQARCYNAPENRVHGARLRLMRDYLERNGCGIVDDVFVPARHSGALAGVTTFGRNNFAYAEGIGSFLIVLPILVDRELAYDEPTLDCACPPNCDACMRACPTGALYAPFHLAPRKCIAHNTFATDPRPGSETYIPPEIREEMGRHVHGCDLCQTACPRNQKRLKAQLPADAFLERLAERFTLADLLAMPDGFYETCVQPIMYNYIQDVKYFRRNAAVAMGNTGDASYVLDLERALADPEPVVRAHVAWALGKLGGDRAAEALKRRLAMEDSGTVRRELEEALRRTAAPTAGEPPTTESNR
jgi:Uncharacterized Fe-S protein